MNIADITPGTQVRITTDEAAPFIEEGAVLTVVDPDAHWDEFVSSQSDETQGIAALLGPPPAWPSDAIAVDHPMSAMMGPAAFREGEFEVVGQVAA